MADTYTWSVNTLDRDWETDQVNVSAIVIK